MSQRVFAVILAAGSGSRLGADAPKQFSKLAGRSIVEHTVAVFDEHPAVTDIILVVPLRMTAEQHVLVGGLQERARARTVVIAGGGTRNQSTRNALAAIDDDAAHVLVHDAARPLLQPAIIDRCLAALSSFEAVDVVIECADTIVEVDARDCIRAIPPRRFLRRGQTPQAFKAGTLKQAYQRAGVADDLDNTDDCTLVLRYLPGTAIRCVEGSENNVKITRPIDLVTADRLFQLRSSARAVTAHEAATLALRDKVVAVFGASSGIGRAATVMARAAGAHVAGFSVSRGVDIRNDRQVAAALRQVADEHGRIDAVLVTAGVLHRGALAEQPLTLIRETFDTNLLGAAIVAREAVPHLRATAGDLLLFTSSSYTRGRASYAAYSASKAAIVNLTQALADECAPDGIRVNCINPERTATPMRARAFPGEDASRMLDAADVAAATLSLLGSGVSGQVIDVACPRQASAAALNVEAPRVPAVLPLPAA